MLRRVSSSLLPRKSFVKLNDDVDGVFIGQYKCFQVNEQKRFIGLCSSGLVLLLPDKSVERQFTLSSVLQTAVFPKKSKFVMLIKPEDSTTMEKVSCFTPKCQAVFEEFRDVVKENLEGLQIANPEKLLCENTKQGVPEHKLRKRAASTPSRLGAEINTPRQALAPSNKLNQSASSSRKKQAVDHI